MVLIKHLLSEHMCLHTKHVDRFKFNSTADCRVKPLLHRVKITYISIDVQG